MARGSSGSTLKGTRPALVGIDVGTSAIKVVAIEPGRSVLSSSGVPTPVALLDGARVEHDPEELWTAVANCVAAVVRQLPAGADVAAVAVASMGEAGLPVDADGHALRPVIGWQDERTRPLVSWWEDALGSDAIFRTAGVALDHSFGLNKLIWVRDNEPQIYRSARWWLSVADYIALRLCGEAATDYSLASRTMALDQRMRDWSPEIVGAASVDPRVLPPLRQSGTRIGDISAVAAAATGLPHGAVVAAGGHDRLCGAFAARGGTLDAVDSVGTAETLVVPVSEYPDGGEKARSFIPCYCDVVPAQWAHSARVGPAGELIEWARRELFAGPAGEAASYADLERALVRPLEFSGIICLPTFGRSATPFWDPAGARGAFLGITARHTRADLLQALMEGPSFSLRANVEALQKAGGALGEGLRIEGGPTRNKAWLQLRADILGHPVRAIDLPDATAVGAALLAGVGAGVFPDHDSASAAAPVSTTSWTPDGARSATYDTAYREAYLPALRALTGIPRALGAADGSTRS